MTQLRIKPSLPCFAGERSNQKTTKLVIFSICKVYKLIEITKRRLTFRSHFGIKFFDQKAPDRPISWKNPSSENTHRHPYVRERNYSKFDIAFSASEVSNREKIR